MGIAIPLRADRIVDTAEIADRICKFRQEDIEISERYKLVLDLGDLFRPDDLHHRGVRRVVRPPDAVDIDVPLRSEIVDFGDGEEHY